MEAGRRFWLFLDSYEPRLDGITDPAREAGSVKAHLLASV